ncbi:MAG: maltose alpha-D-glucosyltransferase [Parvibaculaceae bacterium]
MNLRADNPEFEAADGQIDRAVPDWYRDAIIYQVHVKTFLDSTGDGVGDFDGLIERLDYIADLGVSVVWLMPFYPSPLKDDGYDISDYWSVNPSYGEMESLERFITEAHKRGIRVVTELVINHTSDQHPWFQAARKAPAGSPERDFYVWSDTDQKYPETRIIFLDTEPSNWTWDPVAKSYFWHRFYSHQPDLNFDNPKVLEEILKVLYYWLDKGIDGLRLDAIPYLVEREGTNNENLPETHDVLRKIRAALDARYSDRMLLAEANQWPEDTRPYFGEGDECHMAFHFPLMPRMYMALAQEDRHPITDILRQTPDVPETCQWAIFLRNHDELTLEMVTAEERDYLWRTYATDTRARLNLGIRRRLAPLLGNDRRKIELMSALLMSMPGTPVLYYGDEIGMGDNIYLGDRDGVRTPMQWSADRNAGFSRTDPQRLYLPVIMDAVYGYQSVNVEAQAREPSSLLNWTRRLINARKQHHSFGRGTLTILYPRNRKILAYLRELEGETILCVANLAASAQACELDLGQFKEAVPVELLGRSAFPPIGTLPYLLTFPSYGFYWFLLTKEAELPRWHLPFTEPLPDFITLVLKGRLEDAISGRNEQHLGRDVLPQFLARQRWYGNKDAPAARAHTRLIGNLSSAAGNYLMTLADIEQQDGARHSYFMPLAARWGEENLKPDSEIASSTLAKLRHGAKVGAFYDAALDPDYTRGMLRNMHERSDVDCNPGRLCFTSNEGLGKALSEAGEEAEIRHIGAEQSNVSIVIGRQLILKTYRRAHAGTQPEIEMSRYLTEEAGFQFTPALLGTAEYIAPDGEPISIAAAFQYQENQGDAWNAVVDALDRHLQERRLAAAVPSDGEPEEPAYGFPLDIARTLGVRTAELHLALARKTADEKFNPERIARADVTLWRERAQEAAEHALGALARGEPGPDGRDLLAARDALLQTLGAIGDAAPDGLKTRIHGDYHLGQVLVAKTEVHITDFEGEPGRPIAERREKSSPMRDVAGMLRSFDYAAWSAIDRAVAVGSDHADVMREAAIAWRDFATESFLDAYEETTGAALGDPALALLDLFLLHKALYEVGYEAANRPTWIAIPVRGVLEILKRRGAET